MSSAILYIGIVAIWAFVLVPRWLRRDQDQPVADADTGAGYDDDQVTDDWVEPDSPRWAADSAVDADQLDERAVLPISPRSRAMQARRRLLTMLLTLTGGALAGYLLKLTPWWAVVPPGGMLGMYLLLLREAGRVDAERARWQHAEALRAQAARRAEAAAERAEAAASTRLAEPSAEVIDISARVGDQLYDQYADATIRAVGD